MYEPLVVTVGPPVYVPVYPAVGIAIITVPDPPLPGVEEIITAGGRAQAFRADVRDGPTAYCLLPTGAYGGPKASGTGTAGRNPATFTSGPNSGDQPLKPNLFLLQP